jgi:predicted ribosomally synthesized peptide with SipW-like signal peptide
MRKILIALLGVLLVAALAGAGTFAYFSDTETSSGNTFTAGTLDLTPDDPEAFVTGLTNLAPGEDNSPQSITVTNSGTLDGAEMDLDINITDEADDNPTAPDGTGVDMSATDYAATLRVDTLTWGLTDLLPSVSDANNNGYIDLSDVAAADLSNQDGLASGATGTLTLDVTQHETEGGNDPQGDGVVIEVVFDLSQVAD